MSKKKKLSFRVAHSLAATGIVFGAMACESKPPNVNTTPPEQPEDQPTVNTLAPGVEPAAQAADASTGADAGTADAAAIEAVEPIDPPERKPNVNTPRPR